MSDTRGGLPAPGQWRALIAYAAMVTLTAVGFLALRAAGAELHPAAGDGLRAGPPDAGIDLLAHVLLALVVVILAARGLGAVFRRLHQPPVVGEVVAGILLGPSLLGHVAPGLSAFVLPPAVAPFLGVLAQIGVILFMFLVGLELDTGLLRSKTRATVAISHTGILLPFLLGSALALWIYPQQPSDAAFGTFAAFLGVAMSVTAFPVLARILTDRGIQRTQTGIIAISCAAVDDVTAWCLLAVVVGVAKARPEGALVTIGLAAAYVAFMFGGVGPILRRVLRGRSDDLAIDHGTTAVVFVALLLSALATEAIGIHAIFGAFLIGAVMPHDSRLVAGLKHRLEDLAVVLLLPTFFAFTGLRTEIGLVAGGRQWLVCGAIVLVASAGKFGGSTVAARLAGLGWRQAAAIGILMNTRGLMELVVLNIGLDLRILSPTLFTMMVIMALLTTFATTPVLGLLSRNRTLP